MPLIEFCVELFASGGGEGVELGHAPVAGFFPDGFDEGFALQAVECGVEGTLLDLENFLRGREDALGDALTVER